MKLLKEKYFDAYCKQLNEDIAAEFDKFESSQPKEINFDYLLTTSAVYSSNIEGNSIDLNSFMNNRTLKPKAKEIKEIENLLMAYNFAKNNELNLSNLLNAHKLLSSTLVGKNLRGKLRSGKVGVFGSEGLIYLAVEAEFVEAELNKLFEDILSLLKTDITTEQSFYWASYIHFQFAKIHPFQDGNGRAARLLEKWFLTAKLGNNCWLLPTEKYYWEHRSQYYQNLNIGVNYYEIDYSRIIPFLLLLTETLKYKNGNNNL